MSLRLAAITLRLHRFELVVAVIATVLVAAWALAIVIRLDELAVPSDCLAFLATDWTEAPATCQPLLQRYIADLYDGGPLGPLFAQSVFNLDPVIPEGAPVWPLMTFLPFAVGLLVGVPLVGRELDEGTAQTAWSLEGSRVRWLAGRIWPVALVVGLAMGLTAVATGLLAQRELVTTSLALPILGFHGLPVMARLIAGFGIGLVTGAIVPRALPALLVGAVLCLALTTAVSWAFDAWLDAQPSGPRVEGEARDWTFDGEWRRITPDGSLITEDEAHRLVPDDLGGLGSTQEWLEERGYELVPMGIPESDAVAGWSPLDLLLYAGVGVGAVAAAFVVVDRRRPTT